MMALNPKTPSRRQRRGFTFIEVLFSVIILGVGLIMVAAMLPVAIKQSDDTLGEITAKATAESGFAFLRANATSSNLLATVPIPNPTSLPAMVWTTSIGGNLATGVSQGYITPLLQVNNPLGVIRGNQVNSVDRRFAWVPFYLREEGSSNATVWCIGVRLRNTEAMLNGTYSVKSWARIFNGPWLVRAYITDSTDGSPDRIRFQEHDPADGSSNYPGAAGAGAFVIMNEFLDTSVSAEKAARLAFTSDGQAAPRFGRVLRLGTRISEDEFELDPDYDIPMLRGPDKILNTPDDEQDSNFTTQREVSVWIVGVGRGSRVEIDPSSPDFDNENDEGLNLTDEGKNPFKGSAQDVVIVAGRISVE